MDVEVEILLKNMQNREEISTHAFKFFKGKINGKEVVVVRSGIGKVAAAVCAQMLIDRFDADCVINTGIAGGVADGLHVGDIVVSTSAVQHDFNVMPFGYVRGYMCTGGDNQRPTEYVADENLRKIVVETASEKLGENHVHEGVVATGDMFVADFEIKQKIKAKFNAHATEMEGGAIAQACALNNTPFVVIRAISDLADGSASDSYEQFERKAAENCAEILMSCLGKM